MVTSMTATRQKAIDIISVMPEVEVEKFVNLNIKYEKTKKSRKELNFDSFCVPTKRGENVEEYMEEMRNNDRL